MILARGHLVYLGATTFDLRRIDSLMPPLDDAPVLYRPGVLPGWTSSLIGRVEAVVFDRYGVVTADLEEQARRDDDFTPDFIDRSIAYYRKDPA